MDVTEIKKLMEILDSTDVKEITLETDGTKILLKKDKNLAALRAAENVVSAPAEIKEETPAEEVKSLISLNVGRYYYKDKNGNEMFKPGDKVAKNQVLGYIESIGVRTDVKSDKDGIIKEVLVVNGGIVEFGQPIISILIK